MNVGTTVTKATRAVSRIVKANLPKILTAVNVAGVFTTGYLSAKGTVKAVRIYDKLEEDLGRKPTTLETVDATWKCYIPATVSAVSASAASIASCAESSSRITGLVTAYEAAKNAKDEYREAAEEVVGKNKRAEIDAKSAEKAIEKKDDITDVELTRFGQHLFRDSITGRYFRSTMDAVRKAQNEFNEALIDYDYLDLNNFYYRLEIDSNTKVGDVLGFRIDSGLLDIYFEDSHHPITEEPCTTICYQNMPYYLFDKLY